MNYKILEGKFLLLDTNVVIYYAKYPLLMEGVLAKLDTANVMPILDELVRFEFLRGAAMPKEETQLKSFLIKLFKLTDGEVDTQQFILTDEIIRFSTEIANIYSWKLRNSKIELTDCFLAGQMRKYNEKTERLYFATANHADFPRLFFERIGIETIDVGESILNIGFYRFDFDKFRTLKAEYAALG